jgi:perosamine synthetase
MFDEAEVEAAARVLRGTQLVHGPATHQFERRFADRAGARHAVSVASCTAGLHLSLFVQNIGPGDKVIVPAMTHVATAHAVEFCGATPVFVDAHRATGNIDPGAVEAAIDEATRAVIVVHYLGLPCEMDRIVTAAVRAGVFVVEDCALALDATYGGIKVGNFGSVGSFSFYPIKHMSTVEGGMMTTNDSDLAQRLSTRKAFGYDRTIGARVKPGLYDVVALGYNYRMNEVEAAVGLAQLDKLDAFQVARSRNHRILADALSGIDELMLLPAVHGKATSSHYCFNATLPRDGSIDRDTVVAELKAEGIGTSVHYPGPVPYMSYYREKYGFKPGRFPVAEWLSNQTISLPVGPHVSADDAQRIAAALKAALGRARR